jgi:dTDP-4-dehydrorhamnose reductase
MSEARHILLTGGGGQLGLALRARIWPEGIALHAPARGELDLADPASIDACFAARRYSAVINAGAYTAVDAAESQSALCWMVNASAPARLAAHAARQGAGFIQVSTGYVFDGAKDGAYDEDEPVSPVSVYGASKAAGELAASAAHPHALIVRTSWLVSPYRSNFLKTILARAHAGEKLRVVADQFGNPTVAHDVAAVIAGLIAAQLEIPHAPAGVFHCVNGGVASWRDFAEAVIAMAPELAERPAVEAVATGDYPAKARRPANCALSMRRLGAEYGLGCRPWREAVAETMHALSPPAET